MELSEESACMRFIEKYCNNHQEYRVAFHINTLQEAITEACFAEQLLARRVLILYLYNDNDSFSNSVCSYLQDEDVVSTINDSFYMLCWDVTVDSLHNVLKEAVKKIFDLDIMSEFISTQKSGTFLITTVSSLLNITCFMHESVTKEDFLSTLKQVETAMREQYKIEQELLDLTQSNVHAQVDFCSTSYQQLMFDQLGDRDYDCFEPCEHEHLKDKIAFALWGPPQEITGYKEEQNAEVQHLYDKIRSVNNEFSKWNDKIVISFIYNCTEPLPEEKLKRANKFEDYNPLTDIYPRPIFVLRKCKRSRNPCRKFIDQDSRVYCTWQEYIENNRLPKCKMILPKDGRYQGDDEGDVILEEHFSPACQLSVAVLRGADIASTTVGLASGGLLLASMIPAIPVAPVALTAAGVAGIGVAIYSVVRSSLTLYDRSVHRQDISFYNSDARGAYINIVAGSLGFVGAGATSAVSVLSSRGVDIGQGARTLVNTINGANVAASGIGVASSTYEVLYQFYVERRTPSALTILQLSSSILFFGNAVYNFRTAGSIIEESQTGALNDIQDSLRSNRHRKTFNKLLKETMRQRGESTGRAEVISTIRNMNQLDDVMAVLTRSNRNFNRDGIRFSTQNGEILLNGVAVDILEYQNLHKSAQAQFHLELPPIPDRVSDVAANDTFSALKDVFHIDNLENIVVLGSRLVVNEANLQYAIYELLGRFTGSIQKKILQIIRDFVNTLELNNIAFVSILVEVAPNNEPLYQIIKVFLNFLQEKIDERERKYQERKSEAQLRQNFNEQEFDADYTLNPVASKRVVDLVSQILSSFSVNPEIMMKELMNHFSKWLSVKIYDHSNALDKKKKRKANQKETKNKLTCEVCGGFSYNCI